MNVRNNDNGKNGNGKLGCRKIGQRENRTTRNERVEKGQQKTARTNDNGKKRQAEKWATNLIFRCRIFRGPVSVAVISDINFLLPFFLTCHFCCRIFRLPNFPEPFFPLPFFLLSLYRCRFYLLPSQHYIRHSAMIQQAQNH